MQSSVITATPIVSAVVVHSSLLMHALSRVNAIEKFCSRGSGINTRHHRRRRVPRVLLPPDIRRTARQCDCRCTRRRASSHLATTQTLTRTHQRTHHRHTHTHFGTAVIGRTPIKLDLAILTRDTTPIAGRHTNVRSLAIATGALGTRCAHERDGRRERRIDDAAAVGGVVARRHVVEALVAPLARAAAKHNLRGLCDGDESSNAHTSTSTQTSTSPRLLPRQRTVPRRIVHGSEW
jgi:hypothetical protein